MNGFGKPSSIQETKEDAINRVRRDPSIIVVGRISADYAKRHKIGNGRLILNEGKWLLLLVNLHEDILAFVKEFYAIFESVLTDETAVDELVELPNKITDISQKERFLIAMIEDMEATTEVPDPEYLKFMNYIMFEYSDLLDAICTVNDQVASFNDEIKSAQ